MVPVSCLILFYCKYASNPIFSWSLWEASWPLVLFQIIQGEKKILETAYIFDKTLKLNETLIT